MNERVFEEVGRRVFRSREGERQAKLGRSDTMRGAHLGAYLPGVETLNAEIGLCHWPELNFETSTKLRFLAHAGTRRGSDALCNYPKGQDHLFVSFYERSFLYHPPPQPPRVSLIMLLVIDP